jgi:hypothetical protein
MNNMDEVEIRDYCNLRKILVLLWNQEARLRSRAFNPPASTSSAQVLRINIGNVKEN